MNLETLVERACLESGYNDTDDVAAAAKFARHWDEHIWNSALWKDALVAVDVSIDPVTNEDHAEGIVYLPEIIDRVVVVRSANNQIVVTGQEHYYRMDYDAFAATGTPIEFNILPPAWLSYRGGVNGLGFIGPVLTNSADAGVVVKLIWRDYNGVRRTTEQALDVGPNGEMDVHHAEAVAGDPVLFLIEKVFKPVTQAAVSITDDNGDPVANAFSSASSLAASATESPSYQRLRLLPIPTAAFTLKVLGKAKYEPLTFDQQEPSLRNCTNALLAYIRGSLKRRGGEIGAAQLEFQEANALLAQVTQIEALQAANNQRFLPEAGYGPDHGLGPMNLT